MKHYDFEFVGSPDDVGMKTGATIHTMNGLKMTATRITDETPLPPTNGWWEKQHLKRGLSVSGKPFQSTESVSDQFQPPKPAAADPGIDCPIHRSKDDPNVFG